jgi:glycosyltransferase involved in cell wall biosynthesis
VLSGKVFEYLAAQRPILAAVPPDGAAAALIRETGAGVVAPPDDPQALAAALLMLYQRWQTGALDGAVLSPELRARLDRRARVRELADLLNNLS